MSSIKDRVKGFVERYVDLAMEDAGVDAKFRDDILGDIPQRIQYIMNENMLLKDAPKVKQYVNAPARKMVYINREALRNPAVQKAFGVKGFRDAQRNVLRHEAFHNIPVIGKSEILAHIAGGTAVGGNIFNRVKAIEGGVGAKTKYLAKGLGAKGKSMGRSYLNLWMARPDRALLEHAILGAGIYGGVKAGKAIKGSIDKRKKKQTASSVDKVAMKLASLAANSNK